MEDTELLDTSPVHQVVAMVADLVEDQAVVDHLNSPAHLVVDLAAVDAPTLVADVATAKPKTLVPKAPLDHLELLVMMDFPDFPEKTVFPVKMPKMSTTSQLKAASTALLDLSDHLVLPAAQVFAVCVDPVDFLECLVVTDFPDLPEILATLDPTVKMENEDRLERKDVILNNPLPDTATVVFPEKLDLKDPKVITAKLAHPASQDQMENPDHKAQLATPVSTVKKDVRVKKVSTEPMPPTAHVQNAVVIVELAEVTSEVLESMADQLVTNTPLVEAVLPAVVAQADLAELLAQVDSPQLPVVMLLVELLAVVVMVDTVAACKKRRMAMCH